MPSACDRRSSAAIQGWFRCSGDPADEGWRHWSRDPRRIAPETLTFDMWPDLAGYSQGNQKGDGYQDGAFIHAWWLGDFAEV